MPFFDTYLIHNDLLLAVAVYVEAGIQLLVYLRVNFL